MKQNSNTEPCLHLAMVGPLLSRFSITPHLWRRWKSQQDSSLYLPLVGHDVDWKDAVPPIQPVPPSHHISSKPPVHLLWFSAGSLSWIWAAEKDYRSHIKSRAVLDLQLLSEVIQMGTAAANQSCFPSGRQSQGSLLCSTEVCLICEFICFKGRQNIS